MSFWPPVLIGIAGIYVEKLLGFLVPASWLTRPALRRAIEALPIGLLAALVSTQTFAAGQSWQVDGRLAGAVVGVIALRLRANFLVVVLSAAAVTAIGRALGWLA